MSDRVNDNIYIQPIGLTLSPQSEHGDAIRLAGGMIYAHRFAVMIVRDGQVVSRDLCSPERVDGLLFDLPDELRIEAKAQWAGLTATHAPLQLGDRTIPLDQPQIMGILNVTPDSFSDGGEFLDFCSHFF